jgi:hypothetical protein
MSKTLKRPNLQSDRGTSRGAFVTVHADRTAVGISKAAEERLGVKEETYLHLAFDRTWTPYIGVVEEQTAQSEPPIIMNGSTTKANASLLCRQLLKVVDGEAPDGSVRFYLSSETIEDEKTGATLHRLEVPEV